VLDDEAPKVKVNGCGENSRAHMSRAPLDAALVVQPFSPLSILISTHMSRRHVDCSASTMRSPSRTRRMMHLQRSSLRRSNLGEGESTKGKGPTTCATCGAGGAESLQWCLWLMDGVVACGPVVVWTASSLLIMASMLSFHKAKPLDEVTSQVLGLGQRVEVSPESAVCSASMRKRSGILYYRSTGRRGIGTGLSTRVRRS
jgi:hypothetical protein